MLGDSTIYEAVSTSISILRISSLECEGFRQNTIWRESMGFSTCVSETIGISFSVAQQEEQSVAHVYVTHAIFMGVVAFPCNNRDGSNVVVLLVISQAQNLELFSFVLIYFSMPQISHEGFLFASSIHRFCHQYIIKPEVSTPKLHKMVFPSKQLLLKVIE